MGHDQYMVRVDGSRRVTRRNRKYLRKFSPYRPPGHTAQVRNQTEAYPVPSATSPVRSLTTPTAMTRSTPAGSGTRSSPPAAMVATRSTPAGSGTRSSPPAARAMTRSTPAGSGTRSSPPAAMVAPRSTPEGSGTGSPEATVTQGREVMPESVSDTVMEALRTGSGTPARSPARSPSGSPRREATTRTTATPQPNPTTPSPRRSTRENRGQTTRFEDYETT